MKTLTLMSVVLLLLFSCSKDDENSNPQCAIPTNFSVSEISDFSAVVSWNATNADSYKIEYGLSGFPRGEGSFATTTTASITLTDLIAENNYQYYVQSICSGDNSSDFSAAQTFTTNAATD